MSIRRILLSTAPIGIGLIFAASSGAQDYQRYQPARPTLSPYLNFFRTDVGVVHNYLRVVQPSIQLQSTLNRQQLQIGRQQSEIQLLLHSQRQPITTSSVRRPPLIAAQRPTPPHTAATFSNYSHYYVAPGTIRRR